MPLFFSCLVNWQLPLYIVLCLEFRRSCLSVEDKHEHLEMYKAMPYLFHPYKLISWFCFLGDGT